MVGRFFWASTSDYIGRRNTYIVFFALGILLYFDACRRSAMLGSIPLFVAAFVIILSMYGGGFATIPGVSARCLRHHARRRHSRPAADRLVGRGRAGAGADQLHPASTRSSSGVPKAQAYSVTMYIMCGLLLIGLICNFCMRPVNEKYHHRHGGPHHEGTRRLFCGWRSEFRYCGGCSRPCRMP